MSNKVAVAMSGGVDSSVAAALCAEKYGKKNVFGVTMRLFCYGEAETGEKSCCSLDAVNDAKTVCNQLGIAHYAINLEKEFEKAVISDFVTEYKKGHTPNPCIRCNQIIKFEYLLKKVKSLGANKLATGHYARIVESSEYKVSSRGTKSMMPSTKYLLLRGADERKDQSYFLYGIKRKDLKNLLFPIGEITKTETRKIAKKLKLKTAGKKESQEICFVTGKTEDYLREKITVKKGDIVDVEGNKVGEHRGIFEYTIGQRKGLGGGFHTSMYVIGIDKKKNQIIVGEEKNLYQEELSIKIINRLEKIIFPLECTAKIRYRMDDAECILYEGGRVVFKNPQRAITPGQSIVFYNKGVVVGGGIILD